MNVLYRRLKKLSSLSCLMGLKHVQVETIHACKSSEILLKGGMQSLLNGGLTAHKEFSVLKKRNLFLKLNYLGGN